MDHIFSGWSYYEERFNSILLDHASLQKNSKNSQINKWFQTLTQMMRLMGDEKNIDTVDT